MNKIKVEKNGEYIEVEQKKDVSRVMKLLEEYNDKKMVEMKTIKEHQDILVKHYKENIKEYDNIFDLKMKMINERICPACGEHTRVSSMRYWFECSECNFKITDKEYSLISEGRKGILFNKIRKVNHRTI
jgi:NADH pyrophosphatase NudC (nudix superfamily)